MSERDKKKKKGNIIDFPKSITEEFKEMFESSPGGLDYTDEEVERYYRQIFKAQTKVQNEIELKKLLIFIAIAIAMVIGFAKVAKSIDSDLAKKNESTKKELKIELP